MPLGPPVSDTSGFVKTQDAFAAGNKLFDPMTPAPQNADPSQQPSPYLFGEPRQSKEKELHRVKKKRRKLPNES